VNGSRGFTDEIHIEGLRIFAHHGVNPEETRDGQHFVINAVIRADLSAAGSDDDLAKTVNYSRAAKFLAAFLTEHTWKLLEAAASEACHALLLQFPQILSASVEIGKPEAPIALEFKTVSVCITRAWHLVYCALGSNLGDSRALIETAAEALRQDENCRDLRCSCLIVTKPYGVTDQPDFLNGVLEMRTLYSPQALLERLHELEQAAGRKRERRWGPRTLDLDLLFYDREIISLPELCVPHPDFQNREFVLEPMCELNPYFHDPVSGKTMERLFSEYRKRKTEEDTAHE
jgi:dihydroneopterin aldolase/2-amino-4-hydroxy-6-hydroxymethyldihydropteridine diphosphokinase